MKAVETISTLKCQICDQHGLIPEMPVRSYGRRVVVCQNEFITHFKVGGRHFLVHKVEKDLPELILN